MRGALAALSPCSWDLMPRHLCGRSILSDGASPPAAPSLFGWHRICVCAILAVAGDCFWAAVHDGRRPRLPRLWRSRGRLSSATTASYTWRPGAVAPQPTLGAAVASRLVACFSFLSGPAGDKLCCHVALGDLYPRQHSGTCSARAAALAALRVSLVSLSLSAQASPRSPSWAAWRAAVSAAASSEPRLALRLLEPRLVCRLVGGVAGGRLSLPPPRVLLVSLFVYSSLVSCAASWAAWRAGGCLRRRLE